jgi:hypothetical protein
VVTATERRPALEFMAAKARANNCDWQSTGEAGVWSLQCPRHRDRTVRLDLDPASNRFEVHICPSGCLGYETIRQLQLGDFAVPYMPAGVRPDVARKVLKVRQVIAGSADAVPGQSGRGSSDGYGRLVDALEVAGLDGSRSDPDAVRGEGRYQCPACGAAGDGHGLKVTRADDDRPLFHCFACGASGREILAALGLSWADVGYRPTVGRGPTDDRHSAQDTEDQHTAPDPDDVHDVDPIDDVQHSGQLRLANRLVAEHGQDMRYARGLGWFRWDA